MAYDIDYLPVGTGERSGDAIALRYGNLGTSSQTVMVIDGGTLDSGKRLVEHIRDTYKTNQVDLVWCTHPDGDHACGLRVVLEELSVGALLMHQPWDHAADIRNLFHDGRITDNSLGVRIRASLQAAHDLEKTAKKLGVRIIEPFQSSKRVLINGAYFTVLGPSIAYYQSLLPQFRGTPEPVQGLAGLLQKGYRAGQDAIRWVFESMHVETLTDPTDANGTSAENNSSLILHAEIEGYQFLFTGDAGCPALFAAIDHASRFPEIDLTNLQLFHVPHHGSRRNLGPTVLNRISAQNAFISAGPNGEPKHPSKKVVNALIRRGATVVSTKGAAVCNQHPTVNRPGWSPAIPLEFSMQVED